MLPDELPIRRHDVLEPHHDHCYMCGPQNPASTGLRLRRVGDAIVGEVRLDERHQGVPGLAHGGVIAALMDETAGTVLLERGLRFVTARLDMEYVAPAVIGQPLTTSATLSEVDGRKHWVSAEMRNDGDLVARATALFVTVSLDHFSSNGAQVGAVQMFGSSVAPGAAR